MIKVVRITGEGFNLETNSPEGPRLVLSNGSSEVLVPVSDEILEKVIKMIAVKAPVSEEESPQEELPEPEEYRSEDDEEVGSI